MTPSFKVSGSRVLLGLGHVALALTLILLINEWILIRENQIRVRDIAGIHLAGSADPRDQSGRVYVTLFGPSSDQPALVTLTLAGFDVAKQEMNVHVNVILAKDLAPKVWQDHPQALRFNAVDLSLGQSEVTMEPKEVGDFRDSWGYDGDLSLQVVGETAAYPNDRYGFDYGVSLADEASGQLMGFELIVGASRAMYRYDIWVGEYDEPELSVLISLPLPARLYTLLVALLPVLLLLAAVRELLPRHRKSASGFGVSLEIAVAVIAILPLRSVLVPPDLPGITEVDLILTAELDGFIWLAYVSTLLAKP